MRMSLKKLRKIGDPENLLHRAVLINNTLECVRKSESIENTGSPCKMNTYDHSNYSPEEEQILNSIRLPAPITPISDAQDTTEDNMDTTESNPGESNTAAVITTTEHREHNQDILADKHKHSNTVVEHFYKNLHSLQYIIAG